MPFGIAIGEEAMYPSYQSYQSYWTTERLFLEVNVIEMAIV